MEAHGMLDHHRVSCCVVHHSIKIFHFPQAVTSQLQTVGGKPQAVVTGIKGCFAIVGTPEQDSITNLWLVTNSSNHVHQSLKQQAVADGT
jgi:hypothetical protein